MAQSKTFGRLLKMAVNGIAAYEGKNAPVIEEELGQQIGLSAAAIQRYKAGHLPPEPRTIQLLAEAAVRRGHLDRTWADEFLQAATFPAGDLLLAQLFPTPAELPAAPATPTAPIRTDRNRGVMLEKVQRFWIHGVLEQSLHQAVLLDMDLQSRPEAVERPWDAVIQQPQQQPQPLPAGTAMATVFDALHGEMLILGAPGSGKTTMLLELARDLLDRAGHNPQLPIPVVLNLSTWSAERPQIADWLIQELNLRYQVPQRITKRWLAHDQILPLLDGLDEVRAEEREACVAALNEFRRGYGFQGMVVASRSQDYELLATKLRLQGAIQIQSLNERQIARYLDSLGPALAELRAEIRHDSALRELAASPLMLSIMSLACRGESRATFDAAGTLDDRRRQIFNLYVERMFSRRAPARQFTPEQVRRGLGWLALQMQRHGQSVFAIEGLQPAWLSGPRARLAFGVLAGALLGLAACLLVLIGLAAAIATLGNSGGGTLIAGLPLQLAVIGPLLSLAGLSLAAFAPRRNLIRGGVAVSMLGVILSLIGLAIWPEGSYGWLLSLPLAIGIGAAVGLAGGVYRLIMRRDDGSATIKVVETMRWSPQKARHWLGAGLLLGQALGGLFGLQFSVNGSAAYSALALLISSLLGGFGMAGLALLIGGLEGRELEQRSKPNQGIHQSARYMLRAILAGPLVAVILGPAALFGWIMIGLVAFPEEVFMSGVMPNYADVPGLMIGIMVMLFVLVSPLLGGMLGLISGGQACLQHLIVRLLLLRQGALPWDVPRFLDYAAERLFLRKVGGSYIFVHRLLLEHFAATDGAVWRDQVHAPATSAGRQTISLRPTVPPIMAERRWMRLPALTKLRPNRFRLIGILSSVTTLALASAALGMAFALYTPDRSLERTLVAVDPVRAVAFMPNGDPAAATFGSQEIQRWRSDGSRVDASEPDHPWDGYTIDIDRNGERYLSSTTGQIVVRRSSDGATLHTFSGYHARFSPDGNRLAILDEDGRITIRRSSDGADVAELRAPNRLHMPLAFSADGEVLATVDDVNIVRLWNLAEQREIAHAAMPTQGQYAPDNLSPAIWVPVNVTALALAPDTNLVAAALSDGTIVLQRLDDGHMIARLSGHHSFVNDLAFAPDGKLLASGSSDRTVKLWRIPDGTAIRTLRGHLASIFSVRFAPDGQRLASGSLDRSVKIWRIEH